jgi:hypothetical protein
LPLAGSSAWPERANNAAQAHNKRIMGNMGDLWSSLTAV